MFDHRVGWLRPQFQLALHKVNLAFLSIRSASSRIQQSPAQDEGQQQNTSHVRPSRHDQAPTKRRNSGPSAAAMSPAASHYLKRQRSIDQVGNDQVKKPCRRKKRPLRRAESPGRPASPASSSRNGSSEMPGALAPAPVFGQSPIVNSDQCNGEQHAESQVGEQLDPPTEAPAEPKSCDHQATEAVEESAEQLAFNIRHETFTAYHKYRNEWQSWRDNHEMWTQHASGSNPGFPSEWHWSPTWTREEFDIAHLRRAMELSCRIDLAEKALEEAIGLCSELGIRPFEWQTMDFPEQDGGYTLSEEAATAGAFAPVEAIESWMEDWPEDALTLWGKETA